MPTPQQIAIVARYAERLHGLAKGERGPIVEAACAELGGISRSAFYRWLEPHVVRDRKRRDDYGDLCLDRAEATTVSAYLMASMSGTGKQRATLTQTVEILRANGEIQARRVDMATGEIIPLSDSTIANALRAYGLHPEQLRRPKAHIRMSTEHPNHLWQVDASVCVVFYLPTGGTAIVDIRDAEIYKNKPENSQAIEQWRVIRYVGTDHASGVVRWRYYPHSESGENTVRFLAWMMARTRPATDPFHGAPMDIMSDPGATAAALVKRFCKRLDIHLQVNKPHSPRAKGQVEQGQNLVETTFESGLKFQRSRVTSIEALNTMADTYQIHFNATKIHSRHGETRFASWSRITAEQLRITAGEEALLTLATREPESRDVTGDLTVSFKGKTWDVRHIPGAEPKSKLLVHWHPFHANTAMAVIEDEHGHEIHLELGEVTKNAHGFPSTATQYGTFQGLKDTRLDTNRKQIAQVATGEAGVEAAEKAMTRKDTTFFPDQAGRERINPFKAAEEANLPTWIPKRGTPLEAGQTLRVELKPLDRVEMAQRVKAIAAVRGHDWSRDHYARLVALYPDGCQENDLETVADALLGSVEESLSRPKLALVS